MSSPYLPLTSLAVGEDGTIDHILLPPADREFLIRFGLAAAHPLATRTFTRLKGRSSLCAPRLRTTSSYRGLIVLRMGR